MGRLHGRLLHDDGRLHGRLRKAIWGGIRRICSNHTSEKGTLRCSPGCTSGCPEATMMLDFRWAASAAPFRFCARPERSPPRSARALRKGGLDAWQLGTKARQLGFRG